MKRILTPLLALVFVLGLMPLAQANDDPEAAQANQETQAIIDNFVQEAFTTIPQMEDSSAQADAARALFNRVFDMNVFARSVLGRHYRTLGAPAVARFAPQLTTDLVTIYQTYVLRGDAAKRIENARVAYDDIRFLNEKKTIAIKGVTYTAASDGKSYALSLTFRKDTAHQWRVINISLSGINVGLNLRGVFNNLMTRAEQDFDQVMTLWAESFQKFVQEEGNTDKL